jgi:two-component system sensor histidine kinase DesK
MRLFPDDPEIGWTPYAWLIYLLSFLLYPYFGQASALEWALTLAGAAAFLVFYFVGYWLRERRKLWSVAGILLLGMLFLPFNAGASTFFVYAAAFGARSGPPAFAMRLVAVLLAVLGLESWLLDVHPWAWGPGAVFTFLIGGITIHDAEVSRANAKLRASQEEVERLATTAERERIARDLHDLLGHTLSVITLKAELAGKLVRRDPERAEGEIREVERISREALSEVRSAIVGYRSEGVRAELARARMALEAAGVAMESSVEPLALDPEREKALALALREAVTNVVRHAGARTCRITLDVLDAPDPRNCEVRLTVSDDGRGGEAREGSGLAGMRERIQALGGRLERRSGGDGTTLSVALPGAPA